MRGAVHSKFSPLAHSSRHLYYIRPPHIHATGISRTMTIIANVASRKEAKQGLAAGDDPLTLRYINSFSKCAIYIHISYSLFAYSNLLLIILSSQHLSMCKHVESFFKTI